MRSAVDTIRINRLLGSNGLSTLDDQRGLVHQLAFLVEGHDHFRQLLTKCAPEHRRAMYDSMKPYLGFEPKPLDVYVSEAGAIAEAKQLPTVGPDGQLQPFRVPEIHTEAAQAAVDKAFAKFHLNVTCRKCTKAGEFGGLTKADAIWAAREAGWVYYEVEGVGREVCPDCPVGN